MITIKTIPHRFQRYNTVGDWKILKSGGIKVWVSDLGDERMEFCIAVHEVVETFLCKRRGITTEMVDAFDFAYDAKRKEGDVSEPGDDPSAPYHKEHRFATKIEKLVCKVLGVKWEEYIMRVEEVMLTRQD